VKSILILYLLLLTSVSVLAEEKVVACTQEGRYQCCLSKTIRPPFWVMEEYLQGEKQHENVRNIDDWYDADKYAPLLTLVTVPAELMNLKTSKSFRVPVEVISVPNNELEKTAKDSSKTLLAIKFAGIKKKERIKVGDVGFLHKKSLRRFDDYSYIVHKQAPLFKTPAGEILNGFSIEPVQDDNQFLIQKCCQTNDVGKNCYDKYMFDILNEYGQLLALDQSLRVNCHPLFNNIAAVPNKVLKPVENLLLLLEDAAKVSEGFSKTGVEKLELIVQPKNKKNPSTIKLIKYPIQDDGFTGPFNTCHYNQDDEVNSDAFIDPDSACAFFQFTKTFEKTNKGVDCEVQFGDIFHKIKCNNIAKQDEEFSECEKLKQSDLPPEKKALIDFEQEWRAHKSHGSGECVDIRPFRKKNNKLDDKVVWYHTYKNKKGNWIADRTKLNENYDQKRTIQFMELAIKAGATKVFFNDPAVIKHFKDPKVQQKLIPISPENKNKQPSFWNDWWEIGGREENDHDNHIHICFKKQNPRVEATCNNGVKDI
jgi:hypothetical protein